MLKLDYTPDGSITSDLVIYINQFISVPLNSGRS